MLSNKLGDDVSRENVTLYKNDPEDRYYFDDTHLYALCHGLFSSSDVEIRSAHETSLSFSLIKQNVCLVVKCELADTRNLRIFINDIRKQDKTVIIHKLLI